MRRVKVRASTELPQIEYHVHWMDAEEVRYRPGHDRRFRQMRAEVAAALLHSPELVILDEPTTGLDPQARANLWQHIRELRERHGATIVITTHYLDEADALSDRLVVIDHGKIVASDTQKNLKAQVAGDLVVLELARPGDAAQAAQALERAGAEGEVEVADARVSARVPSAGAALPGLVSTLDAAGIALESLDVTHPTLDDVFLSITGHRGDSA